MSFGKIAETVEKAGYFWNAADPVVAYLKGWQRFLGVEATGKWDVASHNALYQWAASVNSEKFSSTTAWGTEPSVTGQLVSMGPFEDLIEGEPEAVEASFDLFSPLYSQLGLPVGSLEKFMGSVDTEEVHKYLAAILPKVSKSVTEAESAGGTIVPVPPTPGAPPATPPKSDSGLSWGTIAVVGFGLVAVYLIAKAAGGSESAERDPGTGGCGCGG